MDNRLGFATFIFLGLLIGCQIPSPLDLPTRSLPTGAVDVHIGGSLGRAVVADFPSLTTTYVVTLTSHNGYATQSQTVSSGVATFLGVQSGQWDVSVTAYAGTQALGVGSLLNQTLSAAGSLNLTIAVSASQTGTGNFAFAFTFPSATSVDYVSGQLYDSSDLAVGNPIVPTLGSNGAASTGLIAASNLSSGAYRLELTFRRGGATGVVAATLGEAVNIWDNITSDQWLGPDGLLHSQRAFVAAEFNSSDASLASLTLQGFGTISLSPGFSSGQLQYTSLTGNLSPRVTGTRSLSGQKLEYQQDGGSWTTLTSGTASAVLTVNTGTVLSVRVTAPDRVTTKTYQLTLAPGTLMYDGNGATGGTVPSTVKLESGSTITVAGGYSPPTQPGFTLNGWNTSPDGSGTAYAVGANLTMAFAPVLLYAQWTANSYPLYFYTNGGSGSMATLSVPFNSTITLPANTYTSSGKTFTGWATANGGPVVYADGASFTMTSTAATGISLYTVFAPTLYNIRFNANGGTGSMTPATGTAWATPTLPLCTLVNPGHSFVGWALSASGPVSVTDGYLFFLQTSDVDLYAVWVDSNIQFTASQVTGATASVTLAGFGVPPSGDFTIPNVITALKPSAFYGNTGLTSVTLPNSVATIGSWCFQGCTSLAHATLGTGVGSIGQEVFSGCTSLALVTCNPSTAPSLNTSSTYQAFKNCPSGLQIAVPAASVAAYKAATGWSSYASQIVSQ